MANTTTDGLSNYEDPRAAPQGPSLVRAVFGHGATYALAGVVSQGITFLLFPFFAHSLSPRDYGILDLVTMVVIVANLVVALSITQGMTRYLPEAATDEEAQAYASTALLFTLACFTAAAAVALVAIRPLTDVVLGHDVRAVLLAIGVMSAWFNGTLYLALLVLRYQLRPRAYAVVSIASAATTALVGAVLVVGFRVGVIGALIGQGAGTLGGALMAVWFTRGTFRFRFDRSKLGAMLVFSIPLIPSNAGVFLNEYADRIAIRSKLPLAAVGVYGVGYRLSVVVTLTLIGFQGALMPLVLSRHRLESTRRELADVFRLFAAIALTVFLLISIFADELLRLLTRPAYYDAASVVPYLVAASFFAGMYMFAPGLTIAKRTAPYAVVIGVSGVVNAALAFALVGSMGIRGPAVAFLAACGSSFVLLMMLSQRAYHVAHDWWRLLVPTATASGVVVLSRASIGSTVSVTSFIWKIALVAVALVAISRLLNRSELAAVARLPRHAAGSLHSARPIALVRRRARRP